jgi:hypothetical protein
MACWIPSTSHTSRGLQEWPAGIPLPHIPIEDYKNGLLDSLYLTLPIEDYKNGLLESLYLTYQ